MSTVISVMKIMASGKRNSSLVSDYPVDFFLHVEVLRAGVIVPSPPVQERLLKLINVDTFRKLHNPRYSLLSNPADGTSQNCTEFVLDVLNAAVYGTTDRMQLKANAKQYFKPQTISVGRGWLGLVSLFRPEIELSDHDGAVTVATYETLAAYLASFGMSSASFIVTPDGVSEYNKAF